MRLYVAIPKRDQMLQNFKVEIPAPVLCIVEGLSCPS
jgi:hypothetical protein